MLALFPLLWAKETGLFSIGVMEERHWTYFSLILKREPSLQDCKTHNRIFLLDLLSLILNLSTIHKYDKLPTSAEKKCERDG